MRGWVPQKSEEVENDKVLVLLIPYDFCKWSTIDVIYYAVIRGEQEQNYYNPEA